MCDYKYRPDDPNRNIDKYKHYYAMRDRTIKNRQENEDIIETHRDKSIWFVMSIFILPMFVLICFGLVGTAVNKSQESNKDKFIEIGRNSLGCVQYRYNTDVVWKCPQQQKDITQFEREECTYGKVKSCTKYYDPVIK